MKLFALLVLLSTLLVGCGKDDSSSRPKKTPENVAAVSGKFTDFFTFEYDKPIEIGYNSELSRENGTYVDSAYGVIIFRKETKDYMNNVTEIYRVYSVADQEVVLELENTYPDANYGETDDFGHTKYAPTDLTVSFEYFDCQSNYTGYVQGVCLKAILTTNERISDEEIEDGDYITSYRTSSVTTYYDLAGEEIAETTLDIQPSGIGANQYYCKCAFGETIVLFDAIDWTAVDTYDGASESKLQIFDYEDEYYGYSLPTYVSIMGAGVPTVEVFNKKTGEVVISYTMNPDFFMSRAHVLNNGDILVQSLKLVDKGGAYDIAYMNGNMTIDSKLIDIDTGAVKSVECDYFFEEIWTRHAYDILVKTGESDGLGITDSFLNYGYAYKKGSNSGDGCIVFMDSSLKLQAEFGTEEFDTFYPSAIGDYEILTNGNLLIPVELPGEASYVIVTPDGELCTYLPEGAVVCGDVIISRGAFYDLDMKYIADIPGDMSGEITFIGKVGDSIYAEIAKLDSNTQTVKYSVREYTVYYEKHDEDEGSWHVSYNTRENTRVVMHGEEYLMEKGTYIVLCKTDSKTGEVVEYNLRCGDISFYSDVEFIIDRAGDNHYTVYERDGVQIVLLLKPRVVEEDHNGGDEK